MKKLLLVLMIMVYGFSSTGATVQLHYCCGKLLNITWGSVEEKDCGMQEKMGSKPCCETKSVSAKDKDQDQEFYTLTPGAKIAIEPLTFFSNLQPLPGNNTFIAERIVHSPPLLSSSIFILNCVFRI